jgi:hypothetical protein
MTGIALPISVVKGRLQLASAEDQLKKIIFLGLSDCDSANPFQDLGIDTSVVFAIADEDTKARARRRIVTIFKALQAQGRARLAAGFPTFSVDSETQELVAEIEYVNMETTAVDELQLAYPSNGGTPIVLGV